MKTISNEDAAKISRFDLISFCVVMQKGYQVNWHHREIAKKLEAVERGEIKLLIIEMPPRSGKSQLASVFFPAWYLGRNPNKEIICASYGADLASKFGGETKDCVADEQYRAIFPNVWLRPDSKAKNKWKTNHNGSYVSVGIGTGLTGRGASVLIIDDSVKDREEAESPVMREKVWNWYTSVANTRLNKGGAKIIMHTRWHTDDLIARVEAKCKETGEKYDKITFPAIATEDEKYRKKGEALWPQMKSLEELEIIKNTDLYNWYALWQQNPIASEAQEFKEEYFKYFEEEDLPEKFDIDITIDPAISKKKDACNTAIVAVAKSQYIPTWFLLDYKSGKFNPFELITHAFEMVENLTRSYSQALIKVWIEGVAYQESLRYYFEEEMKKRGVYFWLDTFTDRKEKEQRIRGLVPLWKVGILKHRPWMKELESEALTFPVGKTVDILDALAFQLQLKATTDEVRKEDNPNAGSMEGNIMARLKKLRGPVGDGISEGLR